ncbi:MAG: restriction endonuclease subunit S [Bacteroidales bacterium]|nr:restriction endonuclease subunit S [Bacteroidales bacterium]
MKQYDKYKSSGIEWIGDVPEHWEVMPFKFNMNINNGMDYKHVQAEDGYPVIGSGGQFAYASQFMHDGEVVLLGRKGTVDKPLYFKGKFWAVDTMFYAIPKNKTCCRYMFYQAITFPFAYYQTATALPSMTQTDLGNNHVCVPPLPEQQAIASYLDARCADIDKVVATQERRIELLQELKQSEITQAVTRGLNPNVPMKDSGVEWIGMVPEHWEVKKIKFFFDIFAGATPKTENKNYWDGDIVWVTPADYKTEDKFIDKGSRTITQQGYNSCNTQLVPPGSIIFSKRAPIGTVAINNVELCTNQGCLSCVPKEVNSLFYYYVLSVATEFFDLLGSGATFKEISADSYANVRLPYPDPTEQTEIANYLDSRCAEIDKQITAVKRQIELLREYKQSLITEVVTGKRKVC